MSSRFSISGLLIQVVFHAYFLSLSVCPLNCGKTADWIWGIFWGGYGVAHCSQWGICGIAVREHVKQSSCQLAWLVGSGQSLPLLKEFGLDLHIPWTSDSFCHRCYKHAVHCNKSWSLDISEKLHLRHNFHPVLHRINRTDRIIHWPVTS